jgi:hypothetical protein
MRLDFIKSVADPNLYYYNVGDESLILMTYSKILVDWIQVILDL